MWLGVGKLDFPRGCSVGKGEEVTAWSDACQTCFTKLLLVLRMTNQVFHTGGSLKRTAKSTAIRF